MNEEGLEISENAFRFVKEHKSELIKLYANECAEVEKPITLFMAGSPGAGKTEVSKSLANKFSTKIMRIDADEIRSWCPNYTGYNAHLFQRAATKGVHILFDYAIHKRNCHLILDGTFAYEDALNNVQRSLNKKRKVELWFIYQDPKIAWEFTIAREAEEIRRINKYVFIKAFFDSRENTKNAKVRFANNLTLNLLIKNIDNTNGKLYLNIQANELDSYLKGTYTEETLIDILI